jgi:uncharacterized membrane protein YtjA (UPF0391 family)
MKTAGLPSIESVKETIMLYWAAIFFVLAIIAAVFGFSGIAGAAAGIAQVLFFLFLALLLVSAIAGALRGRPPV